MVALQSFVFLTFISIFSLFVIESSSNPIKINLIENNKIMSESKSIYLKSSATSFSSNYTIGDVNCSIHVAIGATKKMHELNQTKEINAFDNPYNNIVYTDEDIELLAKLVYLEARGENIDGQQAVVEVVLNRVLDQVYFGHTNTISEVVFDKKYALQFSVSPYINTANPTEIQYDVVYTALSGKNMITELDVLYFSTKPRNNKIYTVIGNHYFCKA